MKLTIDDATAVKAGKFKGKYKIPIAKLYIAASACSWDVVLISDSRKSKILKLVGKDACRKLEVE